MSNTSSTYRLQQEVTTTLGIADELLTDLAINGGYSNLYGMYDKYVHNRTLLYFYTYSLRLWIDWDITEELLCESSVRCLLEKTEKIIDSYAYSLNTAQSQSDGIPSNNIFGGDGENIITNVSNSTRLSIAVTTTSNSWGVLIPGQSTYQNDILKGEALEVVFINNIPAFKISGEFSFDPSSGQINIAPNVWGSTDTLVII